LNHQPHVHTQQDARRLVEGVKHSNCPSPLSGCGTKCIAGFGFHFEAPEKTRSPSLKFSRQLALNHIAPQKNCENFRILQSHNLLSARWLQKTVEASIYNNAENIENFGVLQIHNLLSAGHLQKPPNLLLT
jgi:hypothetical protein